MQMSVAQSGDKSFWVNKQTISLQLSIVSFTQIKYITDWKWEVENGKETISLFLYVQNI